MERILISDELVVANVELIGPDGAILQNVLKFYNGDLGKSNQVPSTLKDGDVKTSFVLTIYEPNHNKPTNNISINVNTTFDKSVNLYNKNVKRLFIVDRKNR